MNYYERHIGDYLKDTAHLSLLEHGVYTRLLDVYYTREGEIPEADVARLIGARSKDEKAALTTVLAEFFELRLGGYGQARCDREIERFQDKQRKAKASADARWSAQRPQSEGNANASPDAMRTHSEGNAPRARPQSPDTRHQTPVSKPKSPSGSGRARSALPPRPDGVAEQVWDDWLALRAKKRAPVTATVVESAIGEAAKAGMTLDAFLRVWCSRGSQGLEASWLKTDRVNGSHPNPSAQDARVLALINGGHAGEVIDV